MTMVRKPYQHFSYSAAKKEYLAGEMHLLVAIGWVSHDREFIKATEAAGNDVDNAATRVVREVWKPLLAELDEQREAQRDAQADAWLQDNEAEDLGEDYDAEDNIE